MISKGFTYTKNCLDMKMNEVIQSALYDYMQILNYDKYSNNEILIIRTHSKDFIFRNLNKIDFCFYMNFVEVRTKYGDHFINYDAIESFSIKNGDD